MIRAGIYGASGYMGGELLRVLHHHPNVQIAWATSRQPDDIAHFHPNLYQSGIRLCHENDVDENVDVVFLALPTAVSIEKADYFLQRGKKVIDLGAAFRLKQQRLWENIYNMPHSHWEYVAQAVYGISELRANAISEARLVANPGCFSSAAILALAPLVERQLLSQHTISVTGISGSAGIGAELSRAAHHAELGNNLLPYNVVNHRHSHEMEQELNDLSEEKLTIQFTPVYAPITRGILSIAHVGVIADIKSRQDLIELYNLYYADSPFVKIFDLPDKAGDEWHYRPYPWVSAVSGSNFCYIGMDYDHRRQCAVILSVLDSIGKGGAQVAVENMNLMFKLKRDSGLTHFALHP